MECSRAAACHVSHFRLALLSSSCVVVMQEAQQHLTQVLGAKEKNSLADHPKLKAFLKGKSLICICSCFFFFLLFSFCAHPNLSFPSRPGRSAPRGAADHHVGGGA